MKTLHWVVVLAVLAVAAAGWFFVSPLFIDEVVDEPLIPAIPSRADIDAMTPAERNALMSDMMAEAAAGPDVEVDEPMEMAMAETPLVVATGRFRDADAIHKGSGTALLYRMPDGSHVVRFEDFEVTNGPALVVLMASAIDPKSAAEVERSYIKLGKLKGNKGNQNYEIPASVNVGLYRSVVIWCDLFDVLFSPATLHAT